MAEIPELKSQAEGSSTTQQTPGEMREELFLEQQALLDSMDPEFSSVLQDEFDEMKQGYAKEINKQKEVSEGGMLSLESGMAIQNKVLKLKNDFAEDFEGINKIDELNGLDNYEEFKNLILDNALGNRLEEKLFAVLSDFDITQVQRAVGSSLPVDKTGVKLMMKNVKNNVDITTENVSVQESVEQKELNEKERIQEFKEKTSANSEITELLNNVELINVEDISEKINNYKEKYGEDNFYIESNIQLQIIKNQTKLEGQQMKLAGQQDKNVSNERFAEIETENNEERLKTIKAIKVIFDKLGDNYQLEPFTTIKNQLDNKNYDGITKLLEKAEGKSLKKLFSDLKKKIDSEIAEKGIDIKTEKGQEELKKLDSYKDYVSIYTNLSGVSDSMSQKLYNAVGKTESLYVDYFKEGNNHIAVTAQEQWLLKASGFDLDKDKKTGNIIHQSGKDGFGKSADLSKIPPETYLISEKTGFKLAIDLPKIPEELIYERKKLAKNLSINNKQISKLSTSLDARKRDLENKKNNGENFTELESKIADLESKIQDLHEMNEELTENFIKILDIYKDQAEEEYKNKEQQRLETMKFLSKIGFDVIPQYITNQLVDMINIEPTVYGFQSQIDLENGDLGIRMLGEDNLMGQEFKESFMKNFIKAVGNPKDIFVGENISNNGMIVDPNKLRTYLDINGYMGITSASKMIMNLKKIEEK